MTRSAQSLEKRLQDPRPLLLDGATGTELARRGVDLSSPSWTARTLLEQPEILLQIHRDYVEAGAELITANTFRTHARNLRSIGHEQDAAAWTLRAVELARSAARDQAWIAGSLAPLEDCYSPQLTPLTAELIDEHQQMAAALADAAVDVVLIETQVTIREAEIAARACLSHQLPFCVSFVCDAGGRLLSGESLTAAWERIAPLEPLAFLLNCVPACEVLPDLARLDRKSIRLPLGAYANTGRLSPDGTWEATDAVAPAVYAGYATSWMNAGLRVIGGCCGTTPDHISAIKALLYDGAPAP